MYAHPSTQQNMRTLSGYGNHFIEPGSGYLASGLEGKGRMAEPEDIIKALDQFFDETAPQELKGKKVLITAGPTYEKIDPVRFIGNYSSGKMGFALATECARRGAEVILVSGPVNQQTPEHVTRIDVESCCEMYDACMQYFPECDAAILCAAVADFRPDNVADQKIKRKGDDLTLRLIPNPDIAASIGKIKTARQVMCGFALETNDEMENAALKLEKKNLDFIVMNSLRNEGTCFRSDENQITILTREGKKEYAKKPKSEVARDIIDELSNHISQHS